MNGELRERKRLLDECRAAPKPHRRTRAGDRKVKLRMKYPAKNLRTKNPAEIAVIEALRQDGYEVLKRGWPDLLCIRDGKVRFIEVKAKKGCELSRFQHKVANILKEHFDIDVEVLTPEGIGGCGCEIVSLRGRGVSGAEPR